MKLNNYLWAIYLVAFPFFLFPRGNPQIADFFGMILVAVNIRTVLTTINSNRFTRQLFIFIIYTFVANTIWMIIVGDIKFLKNCITYLYCFFLMMVVFNQLKNKSFLEISYKFSAISLVIQTILFPLIKSQGVRTQMFFNNPNQLALWALCTLTIVYISSKKLNKKAIYTTPLFLLCSFLVIVSASRAAFAGILVFWMFYVIKSRKHFILFTSIGIIGFFFATTYLDVDLSKIATIQYNMERFSTNTISGSQSIGTRGFQRITDNPKYLFVGAGEGAYQRFNERIELHSVFANVLFCYGLVGLLLYLSAFTTLLNKFSREVMVLFFALALFMGVHMALRIPILWIALLFIFYLHEENLLKNDLLSSN